MKTSIQLCSAALAISLALVLSSCATDGTTTTTTTTTNAYATAYQNAKYNNGTSGNMTVSFPSSCSMTITGTGVPYYHATYYLTPVQSGGTVVATTASGIQLGVAPYAGTGLSTYQTISATFNICPTKASSTTTAGMGAIGIIFSGTALFNPDEATGTIALADNTSYTFASTACGGTTCTASFLDTCNQHTNQTSTWHYHGNPNCWTTVADGTSNGPSHIIGIALDGFPIYGGRDVNGNVVAATSLDACNGITSATPEFPSGAYHYVLPIDSSGNALKTAQSSIGCYSGTVNSTIAAVMKKLACQTPMLLANGLMRLPDGRAVTPAVAHEWMMKTMPGMQMAGMTMPSTNNTLQASQKKTMMAAMKDHPMKKMSGM